MEAEFHSVVRLGRHLKDATPRVEGEGYVLFAPYTGSTEAIATLQC